MPRTRYKFNPESLSFDKIRPGIQGCHPQIPCLFCWFSDQLVLPPDYLLLDCLFIPEIELPQTSLIKGDRRSLSTAAASILAKTARDIHLGEMEKIFPGYGFSAHKGYGTAAHIAALSLLGPTPIHRRTFSPVKEMI